MKEEFSFFKESIGLEFVKDVMLVKVELNVFEEGYRLIKILKYKVMKIM